MLFLPKNAAFQIAYRRNDISLIAKCTETILERAHLK